MRFSIAWRRTIPFLLLAVLAVTVYALISLNAFRSAQEAQWQTHYTQLTRLIAEEADQWVGDSDEAENLNQIAARYRSSLGVAITFFNSAGVNLGESPTDFYHTPGADVFNAACNGGGFSSSDAQGMTIIAPIDRQGDCAKGFVQIKVPAAAYRVDFSQLWYFWLLITLTVLLVSLLMSVVLHDYSIKAIEKLTIAAQQIRQGNFHRLGFVEPQQELRELNQAFRDMAEHLGELFNVLTSEHSKLSAVLDQMADGVLIADFEGRVQLLNPAAERLFGIGKETGLGRSVVEVLRYHQLVDLWTAAKEGQRQTTMLEFGSQHLFLQATGMPLKIAEKDSILILFQDLTQLRRLETVRRDFISNVSHELRTPLASLKALSETLQEGALEDPPAARRFLLRMETEIDNLTQLVNEILDLSRIESGKVLLSFQRIQPCDLLGPAYERMELQVARAGLELVLNCRADLPAVFADPDRITQVVINLIHNATKATPPGGRITLSAYQDRELIVFFVKDTGVGIPKGDLARIFERFFKSDRARSGGGTGLGLSIARHMVESHGGSIWAESEAEMGSTLYFSLPIA